MEGTGSIFLRYSLRKRTIELGKRKSWTHKLTSCVKSLSLGDKWKNKKPPFIGLKIARGFPRREGWELDVWFFFRLGWRARASSRLNRCWSGPTRQPSPHGLQLYRKVAVFRPIFHNGHVIKPPGKRVVNLGCEVLLFPPQPLITSTKHPGHANALAFYLFFLPCCSSLLFSSSMLHLISCLLPFRFSLSVVHF